MKSLGDYRAVIFDVDGTLYDQSRLRKIMAMRLTAHFLRHPARIGEWRVISTFRRMRENLTQVEGNLASFQYEIVADKLGVPSRKIEEIIERWMHREPLSSLPSCRDETLAKIIEKLRTQGAITIAYSDYPAIEKLAALGIKMDHVFAATDPMINCLKPNPQGLKAILSKLRLQATECFFIGDRMEKDGLCASQAGMAFAILPKGRKARTIFYQKPPFLLA